MTNVKVQESDVIQVVESNDGTYHWLNTQPPYNCSIASPQKESKFKGLKSFIAYQLTPSVSQNINFRAVTFTIDSFTWCLFLQFNNIQVSRRYKHFDWLHERLVEKFTFIAVPPLPDKQIQGKNISE